MLARSLSGRDFEKPDFNTVPIRIVKAPMRKSSLLPLLLLILSACGMADDERVEDSKRRFITIADPAFEAYLLRTWDLDHDGRISYYEAERVLHIDCAGLGIESLYGIGNFTSLQTLDCSSNELTSLDVSRLLRLERLDCSRNELVLLRLGERAARPLASGLRRQSARLSESGVCRVALRSGLREQPADDARYFEMPAAHVVGRCDRKRTAVPSLQGPQSADRPSAAGRERSDRGTVAKRDSRFTIHILLCYPLLSFRAEPEAQSEESRWSCEREPVRIA